MNRVKSLSKCLVLKILFIGIIGVQTISCSSNGNDDDVTSSGLCAGFVDGTPRMHFEVEKKQFCDERDGKKYVYVQIGGQTWMAENLNFNASSSRCYGDDTGGDSQDRCGTYGRLYNWATAMNETASSSADPSGVQGVCPSGWHLPSKDEWDLLAVTVGGSETAGIELKANSSLWATNTGIDYFGFSALPGGFFGNQNDGFSNVGNVGGWWSATEDEGFDGAIALQREVSAGVNFLGLWQIRKEYLFSVRCVKG
ncbi:MAG: hypothetical protein LBC85_00055 [Fibromonadaceae bacterium]|nr:hypothetical protein [Fibromonadaceae bacterium]